MAADRLGGALCGQRLGPKESQPVRGLGVEPFEQPLRLFGLVIANGGRFRRLTASIVGKRL